MLMNIILIHKYEQTTRITMYEQNTWPHFYLQLCPSFSFPSQKTFWTLSILAVSNFSSLFPFSILNWVSTHNICRPIHFLKSFTNLSNLHTHCGAWLTTPRSRVCTLYRLASQVSVQWVCLTWTLHICA